MSVSNYEVAFSLMNLVFLGLDTHLPHLDFKLLYKKTTWLSQEHSISNCPLAEPQGDVK